MTPSRASTISVGSAVATIGLCLTIFAYIGGRIDRVEDKARLDIDQTRADITRLNDKLDTIILQQYTLMRELKEKNGNHK